MHEQPWQAQSHHVAMVQSRQAQKATTSMQLQHGLQRPERWVQPRLAAAGPAEGLSA